MKEIERRFLVRSLGKEMPEPGEIIEIEQGYFETEGGKHFRLRIMNGIEAVMATKIGKGIEREELPCPVPDMVFARELMGQCHHKLDKTRLVINGWEIDIFHPPLNGIIVAEREMGSVDEPVELPTWLKGVIEITDTVTNHHLARLASDLRGTDVLAMPYLSKNIFSGIPRIVLTGPPCSGKTTIIEKVKRERLDIHCVPEMASIIISQFGITPSQDQVKSRRFQRAIYRAQRIFEATSTQFAIAEGKSAILLDRGVIDGAAYMKGGLEELEKLFKTTREAEYGQYDAVFCLSLPTKDIYEANRANNPARSEDYDTALELSQKLLFAWLHHPNFYLIPNGLSWEEKEGYAINAINKAIKTKTS